MNESMPKDKERFHCKNWIEFGQTYGQHYREIVFPTERHQAVNWGWQKLAMKLGKTHQWWWHTQRYTIVALHWVHLASSHEMTR